MPSSRSPRSAVRAVCAALSVLALLGLSACGYGSKAVPDAGGPAVAGGPRTDQLAEVRIGYFPNVTHATALVGLRGGGEIPEELGGTKVATQVFQAGPAAIEALNARAVDMAWLGPSPTINGYSRSGGRNLRIVAGATSGGAALVVDPGRVRSVADLRGKRIATPQLGNTQDVAALRFFAEKGLKVSARTGEGEVSVLRQDAREIPTSFRQGGIDGAWVPEPTASDLVAKGGKVLVDEADLWDGGRFVTTHLVVRQDFLARHRAAVEAVVRGSVRTNAWIRKHPGAAKKAVNRALARDAGRPLPTKVLDSAFAGIEVTDDPLAQTLRRQARHAVSTGLLDACDVRGIYDLGPLNTVLRAAHRPPADDAGLGSRR